MSKYIVELKPIGSFFFGGERTMRFDKEEINNIVQSKKFPQQTSILGMLRKEILVKSEIYKANWDYNANEKDKITKLIGKDSFKDIKEDEKQEFGAIKNISPVFISLKEGLSSQKELYLMSMPKDHKKNNKEEEKVNESYTPFEMGLECDNYYFGQEQCTNIKIPSGFNGKDGISDDFVTIDKDKKIISSDKIFKDEKNIGIKLNKHHKTEDDSLFRVNRYRFNDAKSRDIKFIFSVKISDEIDMDKHRNIVTLGGEGTCFSIYFRKEDNLHILAEAKKYFKPSEESNKIILLSDTFISKEVYEKYCSYSIATITDFRCLVTDYKKTGKHYNRFKRSTEKYSLLTKGSVLYTKDAKDYEALTKAIKKEKMQNIGYNHFI